MCYNNILCNNEDYIVGILQILNEISVEPSTNAKQNILSTNSKLDDLRTTFFLAYSNTNFYLKKIPTASNSNQKPLKWAFKELEKLSNREVTGNAAIEHLKYVLNQLSFDDAEVISRIVKKDLRCGIGRTVANKVWPGIIDKLPVMLAESMKDKNIANIKYPAYAQLKSDGARCICLVDSDITLVSRNYKEFHGLTYLKNKITEFLNGRTDVVLDGELLVLDAIGNIMSRKEGNGIINRSSKNTIPESEAKRVVYVVWDIIPINEYFDGKYDVQYSTRFDELTKQTVPNSNVTVIENTVVLNLDEAQQVFQRYVAQGLEGIILKNINGIWENKRSKNQVKFKIEVDADLICVGILEGNGKYQGQVGKLVCKTKDDLVNVNVSGMSDQERIDWFNDPNLIINTVCTVTSNGLIQDKDGNYSLFLPRLAEARFDKDPEDANTLEDISGFVGTGD
jgi:ATP-dependent DNA ligase